MIDWREIAKWYPMPPGAVPGRPWWKYAMVVRPHEGGFPLLVGMSVPGFQRSDGQATDNPRYMEQLDREQPLPCPPPLPGQVWAWAPDNYVSILWSDGPRIGWADGIERYWPPRGGARLVAGPGAPWQDTREVNDG